MGHLKQRQFEEEDKLAIATDIAVQAGHLVKCDLCSEVYNDGHDRSEKAYSIGEKLIMTKDENVVIFEGDLNELRNYIDEAKQTALSECHCRHILRKKNS